MTVPLSIVGTWLSWLAALGGLVAFGTFFPSDAAAAGGAASPEAPAAPVASDEPPAEAAADAGDADDAGEVAADAAAEGDTPAEEPDEEDAGLAPEVANNPTRLRTRLRRVQRQLGELRRAGIERLRGPNGQFLDVNALMHKATEYDRLDAMLTANPKLREFTQPPAPAAEVDPEFDLSTLPFDAADPANKYFVDQARALFDLQQANKKLHARLDARDGRDVQQTVAQHEANWREQTLAAANQIADEGVRETFAEAMYGHFFAARQSNRLGKVNVKQLIQDRLAKLKVGPDTKKRAAAAAQQAIVNHNANLPKPPRTGATPVSPQKPAAATTETAGDVSKRIRKNWG